MLNDEDLSSRSRTRIPDQFMESELAKNIIQEQTGISQEIGENKGSCVHMRIVTSAFKDN